MNEVTAESLEMANDIYESRHAAGDKVSMPLSREGAGYSGWEADELPL